jgi:hypothetical protein
MITPVSSNFIPCKKSVDEEPGNGDLCPRPSFDHVNVSTRYLQSVTERTEEKGCFTIKKKCHSMPVLQEGSTDYGQGEPVEEDDDDIKSDASLGGLSDADIDEDFETLDDLLTDELLEEELGADHERIILLSLEMLGFHEEEKEAQKGHWCMGPDEDESHACSTTVPDSLIVTRSRRSRGGTVCTY